MLKYIKIDPYFYGTEEPSIKMVKTASEQNLLDVGDTAAGIITDFKKKIKVRKNCAYLLVIAMGAGEWWGPNRNGDYFEEDELIKTHKRFESEAHIYVEHRNTDKSVALGRPVLSKYNKKMHRVELILEFDYEQAKKNTDIDAITAIERIKDGELPEFSMGTHVKYDICSICGNKAKTTSQHCYHIKFEMRNDPYKTDGKRIYMLNPNPHFFDISVVNRGADRTAKGLLKVANKKEDDFYEKLATIHDIKHELEKKAKIVKNIKGVTAGKIEKDESGKVKFLLNKILAPQIKRYFKDNLPFAEKYDNENDPHKKMMIVVRMRQKGHSAMPYRNKSIEDILSDLKTAVLELDKIVREKDDHKINDIMQMLNMFKGAKEDGTDIEDQFDPFAMEASKDVRTKFTNAELNNKTQVDLNKSLQLHKALNKQPKKFRQLITGLGGLGGFMLGNKVGMKSGIGGSILGAILAAHLADKWFGSGVPIRQAKVTIGDEKMTPVPEAMYHPFAKSASFVDDILTEQDYVIETLSNFQELK